MAKSLGTLAALLLVTTCLAAPRPPPGRPDRHATTYWWRTTGAAVTGTTHPDRCSLLLYTKTIAFAATWAANGVSLQFENNAWKFADGQEVPILLHIGSSEITSVATGQDTILSTSIDGATAALLPHADSISMSYFAAAGTDSSFSLTVDPKKMPALLQALDRCRKLLPQ